MYKRDTSYIYSPSDLIGFLENECIPWLDRCHLERPGVMTRDEADEEGDLIRSAGDEHERRFLESLRARGKDVAIIERTDDAFTRTVVAMREGRNIIYQARLERDEFAGYADFLFRVDGDSALGEWHYEVWDTKLACGLKPYFAIQLCCYAEMLEAIQQRVAEHAGIILGDGAEQRLRTRDYWFYYRAIKRAFLEAQRSFSADQPPAFPGMADYRHWTNYVTQMLEQRDDVSLVANLRSVQVEKLAGAGITTMRGLAGTALDRVPKMAQSTFDRLRTQARLQVASAGQPVPLYELTDADPERPRLGFGMLPPVSANDVCFDIEGYPLITGGLEYLLGTTFMEGGRLVFKDWWAHDRQQERGSFEAFVRWVHDRWQRDRTMHIYHYAAYETTALKRLMCRYASCENEIDDLLRNHVFIDLYTVIRQALLVGEPSYSLKYVEHLYRPRREGEVATAAGSIVYYHRWLTTRDGEDWRSSPTLRLIRDYNQADCESTWQLLGWLRARQSEAHRLYVPPDEPKDLKEDTTARTALAQQMLASVPADPEKARVHTLLAYLLEFHRREQKSLYWKMFERAAMTDQELVDDLECLGCLERTKKPPVTVKQSFLYEYAFPAQESKLRAGKDCRIAHDTKLAVTIESIDYERHLLTIKRGKRNGPLPDRFSLIPDEIVGAETIVKSIERTVREYLESGNLPPALTDFLHRRSPRIADHPGGPVIPAGQDLLAGATRAVIGLDHSTLCIQGPPGSGKTSKGGQLIAELLRTGKRVGISSNSHDAICVLLKAAAEAATQMGINFTAAKCGEEDRDPPHPAVQILAKNGHLFELSQLPDLVGATAWAFSHEDARGQFDYLFLDEAGQVSVANLVGMAPATANIVLLGDQMQLGQPIQGVHPGESGQSVLEYYLQDHATVPEELGIFLPTTWRMRPEICRFISDSVYDGRLNSEECTRDRRIRFAGARNWIQKPAGVVYVPVDHDGNTYESAEEAEVVAQIISELSGHILELHGQGSRSVSPSDILVVAPFNLQVRQLQSVLTGVRVGTVDKFQGQQAPIVIFSMTASEGDASPRGIEFLFDKHRLNVAISRAQILAIIVGSPRLERTRCSRLEQMKLVNMFCHAVEEGAAAAGV